jgi:putative cell wall-binding protein
MALALTGLSLAVSGASSAPTFSRLSGDDRYGTAAAISAATFAPGAPVAYVATGKAFADALSGGPAAAAGRGPILLTDPATLPAPTVSELQRLKPGKIVILGGTTAVSTDVETRLGSFTSGSVVRIAGTDRYETSAALSASTFTAPVGIVYVGTGTAFADALAGGPAAGRSAVPILLVEPDSIPTSVATELDRLKPGAIGVLGGSSAVSDGVADQLRSFTSGSVSRLAGPDRYATSVAISQSVFESGATTVLLASGADFPDGLAGGPPGALAPGPLLLVTPTCIPPVVNAEINRLNPNRVVILGGTSAVGVSVENRTECPPPPPPGPCSNQPPGSVAFEHVIWIWMENHRAGQVLGNPDAPVENQLAGQCGSTGSYQSVGSPSLPNYIGATSGDTAGITDDASPSVHQVGTDNLFRQVRATGRASRSYEEAMATTCQLTSGGGYAVKHNPAAYYVGGDDRTACQRDDIALGDTANGALADDLAHNTLPAFAFITPDMCNDTHDCPVAQGDAWLGGWLPKILDSTPYRNGRTAVFIVWDEPTPMPLIVISPSTPAGATTTDAVDHYSLLRTTEELLGLPLIGNAATAMSMRSMFGL